MKHKLTSARQRFSSSLFSLILSSNGYLRVGNVATGQSGAGMSSFKVGVVCVHANAPKIWNNKKEISLDLQIYLMIILYISKHFLYKVPPSSLKKFRIF